MRALCHPMFPRPAGGQASDQGRRASATEAAGSGHTGRGTSGRSYPYCYASGSSAGRGAAARCCKAGSDNHRRHQRIVTTAGRTRGDALRRAACGRAAHGGTCAAVGTTGGAAGCSDTTSRCCVWRIRSAAGACAACCSKAASTRASRQRGRGGIQAPPRTYGSASHRQLRQRRTRRGEPGLCARRAEAYNSGGRGQRETAAKLARLATKMRAGAAMFDTALRSMRV